MSAVRCQWCGAIATGTVTAQGLARPIYDCGSEPCWEQSYKAVRNRVPRTWKLIQTKGRKARPQTGPDLFDLLPNEGK
jgi:hypothetical protein